MTTTPPVVDAAWLADHLDEVVVADVRWYLDGRSGRGAYDAGHLPGAVFVDLDEHLAAHGAPADGRHPLPSPEAFAASLRALGIGDDDVVVAYDDASGAVAARLVWMLRATGRRAAVLDGGLAAWTGRLTRERASEPAAASATARPWPADRLADLDEVAAGGPLVLLDARAAARYRGDEEPVDPRAGHVPGAVSLPVASLLDGSGRLLPRGELRDVLDHAGAHDEADVVASCGSGVTACFLLLALEHAGLPHGRLFPGSFSQWANHPGLPVATGPSPR